MNQRQASVVALAAILGCAPSSPPREEVSAPPSPPAAGASAGAYDPRTDPLVNPEVLFQPAPADPAAIATGDTLYRVLDGNPGSLNPLFVGAAVEFHLAGVLFSPGLFTFDKDMTWRVNEDVVERFEESPDHRVYTVRMKPGLTHHDGQPFTAHDVVFTFESIMDERVPAVAVKSGTDQIEKVEALDDRTVRFTHKAALATNPWNVAWSVVPQHVYGKDKAKNPDLKSGDYYNQVNRAPVGNGPYKFVRWIENDRIEVERWEDYPGPKPYFKRMIFRIIPDQNVHLLSFNKNDVDEFRMTAKQFATQTLAGSDFARLGHKVWWPEWSYSYIAWNGDGSNPFFGDARVRRAMSHALDVPRAIRDLTYNLYERATGPFHPKSWMHPDPPLEPYSFDLERAGKLLDEAGWVIDEGLEGWRHKVIDGKPVKFEFTLLIPQGAQVSVDLAAIFQQDLRSIGVDMTTQVNEWATFLSRIRKHEFQAEIAQFGTGTDPDSSRNTFHGEEYTPDGSRGRNYAAYRNPRVDELYDLARAEFDRAKRGAYYAQIHRILHADQPFTFVWHRATFWALHNRIRGVTAGPRGILNFDPAERAWWVPAGQAKAAADQAM